MNVIAYLVLGSSERLESIGTERILCAERQDDLADVDASNESVGLSESTTHTSLKPISSSARQHLVDSDDVEGVGA